MFCIRYGRSTTKLPPLGSAAGAAAGAEAGAEAGAVVEARTATGGSISQRPNGLECRETRGGSSTVLVTWPEAGYEEPVGGVLLGLLLLTFGPSSSSEPSGLAERPGTFRGIKRKRKPLGCGENRLVPWAPAQKLIY